MKPEENIEFLKEIMSLDKKVLGFRFSPIDNCSFPLVMEGYVGKEAKIIKIHESKRKGKISYNLQFKFKHNGETYYYPASVTLKLFFKEETKRELAKNDEESIILTKEELFNIISYATQKVNLNKEITLKEISELKMYDKNKLFLEELLKEIKK